MRPGYIRKNGIPYSENAVLTENYVRLVDDDGTEYLALTQMVEDTVSLAQPVIRTMLFRKQPMPQAGIPRLVPRGRNNRTESFRSSHEHDQVVDRNHRGRRSRNAVAFALRAADAASSGTRHTECRSRPGAAHSEGPPGSARHLDGRRADGRHRGRPDSRRK